MEKGNQPQRCLQLDSSLKLTRSIHELWKPMKPLPIHEPVVKNELPSIETSSGKLVDTFGRVHNNLRVSVTDRCNLRCVYCMPEDVQFLDSKELLSFEEICAFVKIAVTKGINKVRLTGGEPLLRRDLSTLVGFLSQIEEIKDLSLTTNGMLLKSQAVALKQAGLNRVTISLDTLIPERFLDLCKRDGLAQTLEGIDAGINAGFQSIKLNTVTIKGINDDEIVNLAKFARERQIEIRFIEYMPIGANPWEKAKVVLAHEIIEKIDKEVGLLVPATNYDPMAPAMEFVYEDGKGKVGIIASVSKPFCQSCNRIRITAEGKLRNCLFALEEMDLKPFLRPVIDEKRILAMLETNVVSKWAGHQFNTKEFIKPLRTMHSIGG